MNRGSQKTRKFVNLFIAFAIIWISLSSIISFHVNKIYGKNLQGKLEFVKTSSKRSFKKDATYSLKVDLNTNFLASFSKDIEICYCSVVKIDVPRNYQAYHAHYSPDYFNKGSPQLV
jgi:hypothetical protein